MKITLTAEQKRRANREIDYLLRKLRPKRIIDLLPVIKRRCSREVLAVALERVERIKDKLKMDDLMFLVNFKASLGNCI